MLARSCGNFDLRSIGSGGKDTLGGLGRRPAAAGGRRGRRGQGGGAGRLRHHRGEGACRSPRTRGTGTIAFPRARCTRHRCVRGTRCSPPLARTAALDAHAGASSAPQARKADGGDFDAATIGTSQTAWAALADGKERGWRRPPLPRPRSPTSRRSGTQDRRPRAEGARQSFFSTAPATASSTRASAVTVQRPRNHPRTRHDCVHAAPLPLLVASCTAHSTADLAPLPLAPSHAPCRSRPCSRPRAIRYLVHVQVASHLAAQGGR